MKHSLFLFAVALFLGGLPCHIAAQEQKGNWSIEANLGGGDLLDGDNSTIASDSYDFFSVGAHYWLSHRWALTGRLYYNSVQLLGNATFSSPLKRYSMGGIGAGTRFYFLPRKWVIQPYVGAEAQLNAFNLTTHRGKTTFTQNTMEPTVSIGEYAYRTPWLSAGPKLGCDIHLFRTVSLTFSGTLLYALGGHTTATVYGTSGGGAGRTTTLDTYFHRIQPEFGLKIDLPMNLNGNKVQSTLLDILYAIIASR